MMNKLNSKINKLNILHFKKNNFYKNYINFFKKKIINKKIEDQPFIHTDIFKNNMIISIKKKDIFKTLSSSGTSNKNKSNIYLDVETSRMQQIALNKIIKPELGNCRLPMLIIDKEDSFKNKNNFSARTAAIRGFSLFSNKKYFLLNNDMSINFKILKKFFKKYKNKKFLIFGFTFLVWEKFYKKINSEKKKNFSNAILIHGGGWKKLEKIKITNKLFKKKLKKKFNIKKILNYYGLIEQAGSIFLECKYHMFHTSEFSDIIIRDENFNIVKNNKAGLVQLLSSIPKSYPGHNILTSDVGKIIGENDCKCGKKGKYFVIDGRLEKSEIRGCSDTI